MNCEIRALGSCKELVMINRILLTAALCISLFFSSRNSWTLDVDGFPGASLKTWVDQTWYRISDWTGHMDGRNGLLNRFDPGMDDEYRLDERSYSYSLRDDYVWHNQLDRGIRTWAGSINTLYFFHLLDFRHSFFIKKEKLDLTLAFHREHSREANRDRAEIKLSGRNLGRLKFSPFFSFSPKTEKDDIDFEFGTGCEAGLFRINGSIVYLDVLSDVVFQTNGVKDYISTEKRDFLRPWVGFRGMIETADPNAFMRGELFCGLTTSYRFRVTDTSNALQEYSQSGRAWYSGALVELLPKPCIRVGVTAKGIYSVEDRWYTTPSATRASYHIKEPTIALGTYVMWQVLKRLYMENRFDFITRDEQRTFFEQSGRNVDGDDKEYIFSTFSYYSVNPRLNVIGGYIFDSRHSEIPHNPSLERNNHRLKTGCEYDFSKKAKLVFSMNFDLDFGGRYDGAAIQFIGTW